MNKLISALVFTFLLGAQIAQAANIPGSFRSAKKVLYVKVYDNQGQTIYTGCNWTKKKTDLASCNLQDSFSKKWGSRSQRVEIEHVIPASWMLKTDGKWRPCTRSERPRHQSRREFCQAHDADYRNAHNDLVNLYQSVGAINAKRSAKPFSEKLSGQKRETFRGNLNASISSRVFVPDPSIRGDIARIAFYMARHYGVTYYSRQNSLFEKWNKADPLSKSEAWRCEKIRAIQGQCVLD